MGQRLLLLLLSKKSTGCLVVKLAVIEKQQRYQKAEKLAVVCMIKLPS